MGGEQVRRQPSREEQEGAVDTDMPVVEPEVDMEAINSMLDEIDKVLEKNPEEFVKSYQQRGGQ